MKIRSTFVTFAISAVAGSLLLSACGDSSPDGGNSASPTAEVTSGLPESPGTEPSAGVAPDQQESLPPQPTSTREPISAGALEGDELNEAGVAWFGAFCTGIGALSEFGAPNTEGLSVEETAEAVGSTYKAFGEGFDAAATELTGLDRNMNFENADAFAGEAVESIEEVAAVYSGGADTVRAGSYASQEDIIVDVRLIETQAVESGAGDFGLSSLDESVFDAVTAQVPACASS